MPMSVIYNPINVNDNLRLNLDNIKPTIPLKVINVGSLYSVKNQMMIINALTHLNTNDYHFTHAGVGEMEQEIKLNVSKLNLENQVTFLGKINNVKQELLNHDCFVLSSKTEGFPNVILEAMSVGLPVIATNCMSGPLELLNDNEPVNINEGEFIEGKYGVLINVDDTIALSKALTFFKDHPEMRQKYSKFGFERAKQNNLPSIYNQVKKLLEG